MGKQCWSQAVLESGSQAVLESGSVRGIVFYKHQLYFAINFLFSVDFIEYECLYIIFI